MRRRASGGVLVQYVDVKRAEHNEAYESFWAAYYGFGLILVIFVPCIPRPPISPVWSKMKA